MLEMRFIWLTNFVCFIGGEIVKELEFDGTHMWENAKKCTAIAGKYNFVQQK